MERFVFPEFTQQCNNFRCWNEILGLNAFRRDFSYLFSCLWLYDAWPLRSTKELVRDIDYEWITHQRLVFSLQESDNHSPAVVPMLREGDDREINNRIDEMEYNMNNRGRNIKQHRTHTNQKHFLICDTHHPLFKPGSFNIQ